MQIVTRKEALSQDLKLYYTGIPCKHGHLCQRITKDRHCVDCKTAGMQRYRTKETTKLKIQKWKRTYRKRHADKIKENMRNWQRDHASANAFKASLYRARKLKATPPWLSALHLSSIKSLYIEARARTMRTGEKYQVDHIYPLNNKLCCGLHVPWNLQIITANENAAKKNNLAVLTSIELA